MQFFVDSADLQAIKDLADTGMVDGVTTNPSLVAKSGQDFKTLIAEICDLVPGPVSAEVTALDAEAMLSEADELLAIAENVCIKVPLTWDGLKATRQLADIFEGLDPISDGHGLRPPDAGRPKAGHAQSRQRRGGPWHPPTTGQRSAGPRAAHPM